MIWQYFPEDEIACRCCGKTDMDYSFMAKLVNLRKTLNFPLPLNSAFRCWAHDKNVGGSENHPLGRAVDVNIYGYRAWRLIKAVALNSGLRASASCKKGHGMSGLCILTIFRTPKNDHVRGSGRISSEDTMKKILAVGFFLVVFAGCGALQVKSPVCEAAPENSLICKYIPSPETADIALRLINYEMMKYDVYSKQDFLRVLDAADQLILDVETYADFVAFVIGQVRVLRENYGPEFVIVSDYLAQLDRQMPVSDFDRGLIRIHLERQRKIVRLL